MLIHPHPPNSTFGGLAPVPRDGRMMMPLEHLKYDGRVKTFVASQPYS